MKQRQVGATGLQVSRVGLGTLSWGRDVSAGTARELLSTFVAAGGTMIDTAAAYAAGDAERIIGSLIDDIVPREDVVIATKAGFRIDRGRRVVDTSRRSLLRDLEASLDRLDTDYVDLWQVHAWGSAPLAETLDAIDYAVRSGMVRYAGICNFVGWQTAQAATWQQAVPGRIELASTQIEYSLLARRGELEVIPAAQSLGLGVFPWSPLGRGVLTGKYRTGTPRGSRGATEHFAWFVEPYLEGRSRSVVEAVCRAADGLGLSPAQVALMWVRDAPGVTCPLLGARTAAQLQECLDVEGKALPLEIAQALDDVSGGALAARS